MKTYNKSARIGEITLYQEVLNPLADRYNSSFSTLVLPKSLSINTETGIITMPFYEGQTFNSLWNESTGGSLLNLDLSLEVPMILKNLVQIDILDITQNEKIKEFPNLTFDHHKYLSEFNARLEKYLNFGFLKTEDVAKAIQLLKKPYVSKMIFNNGDFYPRNFIRTPEKKMVLIDWEMWNPGRNPFYLIDYIENVAAVCFVHMWSNIPWQKKYVSELQKTVAVTKDDFQKAILIKSLELADFWFKDNGNNELCKNQVALFRNALLGKYMEQLWEN